MSMLSQATLDKLEQDYPGIQEAIARFESAELPACPKCDSGNTAQVQAGVVGRNLHIAAATRKIILVANGAPGKFFCHQCRHFFNEQAGTEPDQKTSQTASVSTVPKKSDDETKSLLDAFKEDAREEEEMLRRLGLKD